MLKTALKHYKWIVFFLMSVIVFEIGFISSLFLNWSELPANHKNFKIEKGSMPAAFIVQSGSMEPAIATGSLIFSIPLRHYRVGEVVTFSPTGSRKNLVTHRIVDVSGEGEFTTKGDANEDPDSEKISIGQIVGRAFFPVPFVGYVANFAKNPKGFILLVIVPATIVIYEELKNLKKELAKFFGGLASKFRRKNREAVSHVSYDYVFPTPLSQKTKNVPIYAVAVPVLGSFLILAAVSLSYFSDNEKSVNNVLGAAENFDSPTPTESEPTPVPGTTAGDVVINEIMWMGTQGRASDEWIELRNMTNSTIDLSNWTIFNLGTGAGGTITIPPGKIIPAVGYFLISNRTNDPDSNSAIAIVPDHSSSSVNLINTGEQLILKNSANAVIDTADDTFIPPNGWFAGIDPGGQNPERAMERNLIPGDGSISTNWHNATVQVNIDSGGREIASPGAANSAP